MDRAPEVCVRGLPCLCVGIAHANWIRLTPLPALPPPLAAAHAHARHTASLSSFSATPGKDVWTPRVAGNYGKLIGIHFKNYPNTRG